MASAPIGVRAERGALPWGAIFAGLGVFGVLAVGLLRLDRLPITFCMFKQFTGLPCPTCGTTRALGRLFALDVTGAFAMNPLAALGAALLLAWAVADLAFLTRGGSLSLSVSAGAARVLRVAVVLAIALNWAYLVAAGR
jgi:hypothetical protein